MDNDIKEVITATIKELQQDASIQLRKPTTLSGWLGVLTTIGIVVGFMWTSVVYLNKISDHHNLPYHSGSEELVAELKPIIEAHASSEELHKGEAELELQIIKATRPIETKVNQIGMDVQRIQTNVDILLEDSRRRNQ